MANENSYRSAEQTKNDYISQLNASMQPCVSNLHGDYRLVERRSETRRNGQNLAGSGALVFEGELLEIPVWN